MKGKFSIFVISLLMILLPTYAHAAGSFRVNVKCENVEVGSLSKCSITGTVSGTEVSSFHGKINVSGSATFDSFKTGSGFNGEGGNGIIDLYTDTLKSGTFSIGTVYLKANSVGSGTLTISNIEASDTNFENISGVNNATGSFNIIAHQTTVPTTKKSTTVTTKNVTQTVTTTTTRYIAPLKLTSVKVDDFPVTYENDIYYVTVNQDTTEVTIDATAGEGITIIGLGKRTLADGKNVIDLVLKNEFDQTATINVVITKPNGQKEVDTKLAELKVVNYGFTFNPETLEYSITVPYNVKEIYIIATPKSDDVTVSNAGLQVLSNGKNEIKVKSSFGDISETIYTIKVKRNYMSLIFLIGFIGSALSFGGYAYYTKKKKENVKDEVVKEIALENRETAEKNMSVKASFNGESSVGVGKRIVVPTRVVQAHTINSNNEQMMTSTPAPQVKVIKTINTNASNNNFNQQLERDVNEQQ